MNKAKQIDFLLSQVRNSVGSLANGMVYFYAAGTTTPKSVWLNREKTILASNPYRLDTDGKAHLYADGLYKVVIKNAAGSIIYTHDNLEFVYYGDLVGYEVDALMDYGNGTAYTKATIEAALAGIGGTNATLLLRPGIWSITGGAASITFPDNVSLKMPKGSILSFSAGYTININGFLNAGDYQIFISYISGSVRLATLNVNAAWWGYTRTVSVNVQKDAIAAAIVSLINGGIVLIDKEERHVIAGAAGYVADETPKSRRRVPLLEQTIGKRNHPITVGKQPRGICFDGTHIWVNNYGTGTVSKIDIITNTIIATITVGSLPFGNCFDGTHVWVANNASSSVSKIDIATNSVVETITVGLGPRGICFDGTHIWVTNSSNKTVYLPGDPPDTVSKIDIITNTVVATIPIGRFPYGIAFDGNKVWVANFGADMLKPQSGGVAAIGAAGNVDAGTHSWKITYVHSGGGETLLGIVSNQLNLGVISQVNISSIPIGPPGIAEVVKNPAALSEVAKRRIYRTVAGDTGAYKYVGEINDNTTTTFTDNIADAALGADGPLGLPFPDKISSINISTNAVVDVVTVPYTPCGVAFDGKFIWYSSYGNGELYKIDVSAISLVATVKIGGTPEFMCFNNMYLWATSNLANAVYKVDVNKNAVVEIVPVGNVPFACCYDGTYIWVSNFDSPAPDFVGSVSKVLGRGIPGTSGISMGTFTIDTATLPATSTISGLLFRPTYVILLASVPGTPQVSIGISGKGNLSYCILNNHVGIANSWSRDDARSIFLYQSGAGIYAHAVLGGFTVDGFTLNWTSAGAKVGIATIYWLAFGGLDFQ